MKKIIIWKGGKYGIFWPFKMPVRKTKLLCTTRPYSRLNEEVHILRRPNTSKNIRGLMWKKGFSEGVYLNSLPVNLLLGKFATVYMLLLNMLLAKTLL